MNRFVRRDVSVAGASSSRRSEFAQSCETSDGDGFSSDDPALFSRRFAGDGDAAINSKPRVARLATRMLKSFATESGSPPEQANNMSVKKYAELEAVIKGRKCVLNSFGWTSSDPSLAVALNDTLATIPHPLVGFYEVAEEVIRRVGESAAARVTAFWGDFDGDLRRAGGRLAS